jgi:hypothetical protein
MHRRQAWPGGVRRKGGGPAWLGFGLSRQWMQVHNARRKNHGNAKQARRNQCRPAIAGESMKKPKKPALGIQIPGRGAAAAWLPAVASQRLEKLPGGIDDAPFLPKSN